MGVPTPSDLDLPPTYTEATASPSSPFPTTSPTTGLPLPSPLTTHLRTLPARLRQTQLVRQTSQASHDLDLTALLVPHVEAFLADLTSSARVPHVAELTLVPATPGAVPDGWAMSGAAERRREGEVVRVARVRVGKLDDGKGGRRNEDQEDEESGDGRTSSLAKGEAGFDEWGRFETEEANGGSEGGNGWWFRDEDMARRLAAYLRPEPNLERKHVQATVVEKKAENKQRSGWGRWGLGGGNRRKSVDQTPPVPASPASPAGSSPGAAGGDDSVKMTVRAEEVTFRKENEFGIWESRTGWGIVVTVRVKP
ncbi:hypothetical protein VTI74DRAFT_3990 [Chaetomium olivicolor]